MQHDVKTRKKTIQIHQVSRDAGTCFRVGGQSFKKGISMTKKGILYHI